jgi:hypothetical protein
MDPAFLEDRELDYARLKRMEQRCESILTSLENARHFFPDTGLPTNAGILHGASLDPNPRHADGHDTFQRGRRAIHRSTCGGGREGHCGAIGGTQIIES